MAEAQTAAKPAVLSTVGRGYAEFGRMFLRPLWLVIGVWSAASYLAMVQAGSWLLRPSLTGHEFFWLPGIVLTDIVQTAFCSGAFSHFLRQLCFNMSAFPQAACCSLYRIFSLRFRS
jgi:hypothetical protein